MRDSIQSNPACRDEGSIPFTRLPNEQRVSPHQCSASVKIPLTRGLFAIVDEADLPLVSQCKWLALSSQDAFYAYNRKAGLMHRLILGAQPNQEVDHRDRDRLNNRRSNLRIATRSQNCRNRNAKNKTGFKGVHKIPTGYQARITISGGKQKHIGVYPNPILAARAYDSKAIEFFGEFACLNFPRNTELKAA